MRFLIYSTQTDAQAAVDQIDANGRLIFAARGFEIDADGNVVGKRLIDGTINREAAVTTTWYIPEQRLDGKWIVSHPENAMGAGTVVDGNGTTAADFVMAGVAFDATEDYADDWFPQP